MVQRLWASRLLRHRKAQLLLVNLLTFGLEVCLAAGITYVPPLLLEVGVEEKFMTMVLGESLHVLSSCSGACIWAVGNSSLAWGVVGDIPCSHLHLTALGDIPLDTQGKGRLDWSYLARVVCPRCSVELGLHRGFPVRVLLSGHRTGGVGF